ncbi:glycosyltransferase family 87 protein [Neoroseomonas soli]|uniref:DUF2029 domain-containing protein n=1 Tax=Neoroseomonas soli TaxID=1081025 RepID=A0A9X9WY08_9PROT|nr:glycosyltransferase family 87 protein [Neoroseomonas soli]MBR0672037.1 DUF2029 domain-containing protein [Neoroseomonas soli]
MAEAARAAPLSWIRDGHWLTGTRAALYGAVLALVPGFYLAVALQRMAGEAGRTPGTIDFSAFYAASSLALSGTPAVAWDRALHAAAHGTSVAGGYFPFLYPPTFLLLCLPLALLPFALSFFAWIGTTWAACVAALSAYRAAPWPAIALICTFAPVAVQNVANGQNGFLTTALFAAAGVTLDRRPALAGAILAVLSFKPQLGLLVLPALLSARRWRVLGLGTVAGALLVIASVAAFGTEPWRAFLAGMPTATHALDTGQVPMWQFQSVFGFLRTLGVDRGLAYVVQGVVTLAAVLLVAAVARRRPGGRAEIAAMAAGAPLATPYIFAYDLTLLLLPVVWLWSEARRAGFLPWEKTGLVFGVATPAASIGLGLAYGVSIGPVAALIVLALVIRRINRLSPR